MVRCRIMHISPKQTTKKININLCNATLNNEMIYPHQLTHSPPYNRLKQNWRKINQHTKNTKSFRFLAVLLTDNYVVCSCIIRYLIADVMSIGCDESKGIAVAVCLFRFVCVRIFFLWMIRLAITTQSFGKNDHFCRSFVRKWIVKNRKLWIRFWQKNRKIKCHSLHVPDDGDLRVLVLFFSS